MEETVQSTRLEYASITTLALNILDALEQYINLKFSHIDVVKAFNPKTHTIHDLIAQLAVKEKANAQQTGFFNGIINVGAKAIKPIVGDTPFYRIVHLRYYASRAAELQRCTAKLAELAEQPFEDETNANRASQFEQNSLSLFKTINDIFNTTEFLTANHYKNETTIKIGDEMLTLPGLGGGRSHSELGELLTKAVNTKDKTRVLTLQGTIKDNLHLFEQKNKDEQLVNKDKLIANKGAAISVLVGLHKEKNAELGAVKEENIRLAELTAQQHSHVFAAHPDARENNTELCAAVLDNNVPKVRALLNKTNANLCSAEGRSLLSLALLDKSGQNLKEFKVEELDNPNSPTEKTMTIVRFLLDNGADPTEAIKGRKRSLLHMLVFNRSGNHYLPKPKPFLPLIKLFVSYPCDLSAGETAGDFSTLIEDTKNMSEVATLLREAKPIKGKPSTKPILQMNK